MGNVRSFKEQFESIVFDLPEGKAFRLVSEMLSEHLKNAELPLLVEDMAELLTYDEARTVLGKIISSHDEEVALLCSNDSSQEA